MGKIYVLGAGASGVNSKYPCSPGLPMMSTWLSATIDYWFWRASKTEKEKLKKFIKPYLPTETYEAIENDLNNNYVRGDDKAYPQINIEEILTSLYRKAKKNRFRESEYHDAEVVFYKPICSAQIKNKNYKPYIQFTNQFCEKIEEVTIITFNYDHLIENSLLANNNKTIVWDYCCNFDERFLGEKCTESPSSHIKLLKLHGSFNWIVNKETKKTRLKDTDIREDWNGNPQEKPILIPPILEKEFNDMPLLPVIWKKAREELRNCTEIHFIGYSLPDADEQARKLFEETLSGKTLNRLVIVNPDRQCDEKFKSLVRGFEKFEPYNSFYEYLELKSN